MTRSGVTAKFLLVPRVSRQPVVNATTIVVPPDHRNKTMTARTMTFSDRPPKTILPTRRMTTSIGDNDDDGDDDGS
jgi:hypothetical protein